MCYNISMSKSDSNTPIFSSATPTSRKYSDELTVKQQEFFYDIIDELSSEFGFDNIEKIETKEQRFEVYFAFEMSAMSFVDGDKLDPDELAAIKQLNLYVKAVLRRSRFEMGI